MENLGQQIDSWSSFWKGSTPKTEIQMWDYYGLRPWIMKYTPRYGKVIEAGCGLGRYNFYLSRFGIDMEGVDFEKSTIDYLNKWKNENGFSDLKFTVGDVTNLDYPDSSISGYISLGVVEHFIEGPKRPLEEAYRVLRPGGVAIISTPSISWHIFFQNYIRTPLRRFVKRILFRDQKDKRFFQYWYRPRRLMNFVSEVGFQVTNYSSADLLYSFIEAANFKIDSWRDNSIPVVLANFFEGSALNFIGAQSITISVKTAESMHCFLCDDISAKMDSLTKYDVPICIKCQKKENAQYYRKGRVTKFHAKYLIFPPINSLELRKCEISGENYFTDGIFEDYGLCKNVKPELLRDRELNIQLSNTSIQPILRKRK